MTTAALSAFGIGAFRGEKRRALLPGETTHGHYQIELSCESCHSESFPDRDAIQQACLSCHDEELTRAEDSHPKSKFTDPRNASRTAKLDARYCVTCHTEHRPDATVSMGLTLPQDYCFQCHLDIAEDRPSHRALGFETCASAGCHNFHDNRALYEDFLVRHADEAPLRPMATLLTRSARPDPDADDGAAEGRAEAQEDGPTDWQGSAHHLAGTACADCHGASEPSAEQWQLQVSSERCADCHASQYEGFTTGRHGMRLAAGLPPMTPGQARLPMRAEASHASLTCTSCHGAHRFDTQYAASRACLGCHDDSHSRAYTRSPHAELWLAEQSGALPAGSGVSCASCHMPRLVEGDEVTVQHNQNDNLRPNEKMIRSVCMHCHGLPFSIDALSDERAHIRVEAAYSLGELGAAAKSSVAALKAAMDDDNPAVRIAVAEALEKIEK